MISAQEKSFFYCIKVQTKLGGERVDYIIWNDMTFQMFGKWMWYFKYRAALMQVKYPKFYVATAWGGEEYIEKSKAFINNQKNKLTRKKGLVTTFKNRIQQAKDEWFDLYPIEDYEPFKNLVSRYEKHCEELAAMMLEQTALA